MHNMKWIKIIAICILCIQLLSFITFSEDNSKYEDPHQSLPKIGEARKQPTGIDPQEGLDMPTILGGVRTEFTDQDILDFVYSNYEYPLDFSKESEYWNTSIYLRSSLLSQQYRDQKITTDNVTIARDWFNDYVEQRVDSTAPLELIGERENEKYFEFQCRNIRHPQHIYLIRIHKPSYIRFSEKGHVLGYLHQRPITLQNVKEFGEYHFYIKSYNIYGYKVLSSFSEDKGDSIVHTIYHTRVVGGDWGMCDGITLVISTYNINKESGEITRTYKNERGIQGYCNEGGGIIFGDELNNTA